MVEGPWIIKRNDYYYLFYSGHCYCDNTYAVGVARSKDPLGPYEKKGDPIMKTNGAWAGPGHCSVIPLIEDPDTYVMIYHAWEPTQVCANYDRLLLADYVLWDENDWPYMTVGAPTLSFQQFLQL